MAEKDTNTLETIKGMFDEVKSESIAKIKEIGENSNKKAEEIEAKIKSIEADYQKRLDEVEKKLEGKKIPGLAEELAKKQFSFQKAFAAMRWPDLRDKAGYEFEIMKAASAGDGSSGGFMVADEVSKDVIELALANMPIKQLGCTEMRGLVGNMSIPKTTGRPTGYWVGENSVPTESNTTFGEIKLDPKRVAGFTKVSERLIRQAPGVAEPIIRKELANGLLVAIETAIISGSGSSNEPKGIVNYSGLTSTTAIGASGGRFTAAKAQEMITNIEEANHIVETGKFGFLTRPVIVEGMKLERIAQYSGDTGGAYVYAPPILSNSQLENLIGYPIKTTSLISNTLVKGDSSTCGYVIAGDWAQVLLAMWSGLEIKVSDTTAYSTSSAFLQNQMWLVAQQEMDINIKDATGLTVISDAECTRASW